MILKSKFPPLFEITCSKVISNTFFDLILFHRKNQPLWNYEDITAKVWSIRSVEQLDIFLQHVVRVFRDSLPHALISERWSQTALQLGKIDILTIMHLILYKTYFQLFNLF